jgi:hypothetical protein
MLSASSEPRPMMSVPTYNPMLALRRFVGLRSAWRRSLAMEPRPTVAPPCPVTRPPQDAQATDPEAPQGSCRAGSCHV